jgi:hypothetical protein
MNRDLALLAVEDALSEAVARRLLSEAGIGVAQVVGRKGNSYLRAKVRDLNRTARGFPVLLLTDLDSPSLCPPLLIRDWLNTPPSDGLMFRVAVMEVESWVMADTNAFSRFLGVRSTLVPQPVDAVLKPKEALVNLARRSRRRATRSDLVPSPGSTAAVGPAYNARLGEFVRDTWCPIRAADASSSLSRALNAVRAFRSGTPGRS